jgi:hypothetical protein
MYLRLQTFIDKKQSLTKDLNLLLKEFIAIRKALSK